MFYDLSHSNCPHVLCCGGWWDSSILRHAFLDHVSFLGKAEGSADVGLKVVAGDGSLIYGIPCNADNVLKIELRLQTS